MNEYRELEVYIGPYEEWRGEPLNKKQAIRLVSNGNVNTLKISASIMKTIAPALDRCSLEIYNLSEDTRKSFKRGMSVNVFAGYEGQEKELVYKGGLAFAVTDRQGPDIITTLVCTCLQGGLMLAKLSKTYTQGVQVSQIVKELAETIPGVTVNPTNIKVKGTIGYAGFSFAGMTSDALNKLGSQFGFTWKINDGIFSAVQDGQIWSDGAVLSVANLRKVSPRISGPWPVQNGVDILAQYAPNVGPGKSVQVNSQLNPRLNRKYQCYEITYNLSPKDNAWEMHIVDLVAFSEGYESNG